MSETARDNTTGQTAKRQNGPREGQEAPHTYIPDEELQNYQKVILEKYARAFEMLKNA